MCPVNKVTIQTPSAATLRGNVAKLLLLEPRCSRGEESVSNSCGGRRRSPREKSVWPLSAEAERSRLSRGERRAPGATAGHGGRRENWRRGYDRKARVIDPRSTRRLLCKESVTMETSAEAAEELDPDRSTDSKRFDSRPFRNRQRKEALSKTITKRKGGTHALNALNALKEPLEPKGQAGCRRIRTAYSESG